MTDDVRLRASSGELSEGAREFLRATVIAGASLERFRLRDQIVSCLPPAFRENVQSVVEELSTGPSPLIRLAAGGRIFLTPQGGLAARELFAEAERAGENSIVVRRIQRRGSTNREMAEYAASVGARLWQGELAICSSCHEHNSFGVKTGRTRICQLCFSRGIRL